MAKQSKTKSITDTDSIIRMAWADRCSFERIRERTGLRTRKPGASICPSEAARAVFSEEWREHMPQVREVANEMAKQGRIEICQKGSVVDPATAKGPIRLRMSEGLIG